MGFTIFGDGGKIKKVLVSILLIELNLLFFKVCLGFNGINSELLIQGINVHSIFDMIIP